MNARLPAAFVMLLLAACGSHADDEIPDALLDAIRGGNAGDHPDYPSGPKGSAIGDVAPNVCVTGWLDPKAADFDLERTSELCFDDFWDPEGDEVRLLLVNTAAIWCSACQVEYAGSSARPSLASEVEARRERGLAILGTLFQNANRDPAAPADGQRWAQSFDVDFPFGIDPGFEMGVFADADVQPFNLVLDATNMRVVLRMNGDNPNQLWPAIDERLGDE